MLFLVYYYVVRLPTNNTYKFEKNDDHLVGDLWSIKSNFILTAIAVFPHQFEILNWTFGQRMATKT